MRYRKANPNITFASVNPYQCNARAKLRNCVGNPRREIIIEEAER